MSCLDFTIHMLGLTGWFKQFWYYFCDYSCYTILCPLQMYL